MPHLTPPRHAAPSTFSRPPSARGPSVLLLQFPWMTGYNASNRIPTLLHSMGYACALAQLGMRMVALVHPDEMDNCARLCRAACSCAKGEHRSLAHRSIAKFARGEEDLLFAHADMWVNLRAWGEVARRYGDHTLSPLDGLLGTDYSSTRSLCITEELLPESHAWFWWLDSKAGCIAAIPHLPLAIRKHVCCYGWSDLAYLPRHTHKLFRSAVRNGFWNVQVEVAVPTILNALALGGIAPYDRVQCLGGSNADQGISPIVRGNNLCAHRVQLQRMSTYDTASALARNARRGAGGRRHNDPHDEGTGCEVDATADGKHFPGRRVVLSLAGVFVNGGNGFCWVSTDGFNLPERANQTTCDFRYSTREEARTSCEAHEWCGGIMRDNGVRCPPDVSTKRFQLRMQKTPPRYGFRGDYSPWVLYRQPGATSVDAVREWCDQKVSAHNQATKRLRPEDFNGASPFSVVNVQSGCSAARVLAGCGH